MEPTGGFERAGAVEALKLDIGPQQLPEGRVRHAYGQGPFAKLKMPPLPQEPGVYLWELDGEVVYVGQTRMPLKDRLGPLGYASISNYNTFARQPGRTNGGQQTNCRINSLANRAISTGATLVIWYRTAAAKDARKVEASWMDTFGIPRCNLRDRAATVTIGLRADSDEHKRSLLRRWVMSPSSASAGMADVTLAVLSVRS